MADQVDLNQRRLEQLAPVRQLFRAPSSSRPGMFHYTILFEDGRIDCTCEGWRMNGKCWHTTTVLEEMGIDAEFTVSLDDEG